MRVFSVLVLFCTISAHAVNYSNTHYTAPTISMQSVNSGSYMSSGSSYSAEVYSVGASAPASTPSGPRKAPPDVGGGGGDEPVVSDYTPTNPQFSPIGNGLLPLILIALVYTLVIYKRKKHIS